MPLNLPGTSVAGFSFTLDENIKKKEKSAFFLVNHFKDIWYFKGEKGEAERNEMCPE